MNKLIALLLLFLTISFPAYAKYNFWPSQLSTDLDVGASTGFAIDSALVFGTSGDSIGVEHAARYGLSNETIRVYVYVNSITGTPDSMTAYIYNPANASGDDPDRPDTTSSTVQYTSDTISMASGAGWHVFTFTGVTWPVGKTLWFIIANTHATPASNFPTIEIRGALEGGHIPGGNAGVAHRVWQNTSGWTLDGTVGGAYGSAVVEYVTDGVSIGHPYIVQDAAHASNTNYRGNRFTPTEDLKITCIHGTSDSNFGSLHVVQNTTDSLNLTITDDWNAQQRGGGTCFEPVTVTGGLAWDILQKASSNDTFGAIYTMGTGTTPDAVKAAGGAFRYVDGATLGSLTYTETKYYAMMIEFSDNPAQAGGSNTDLLGVIQ